MTQHIQRFFRSRLFIGGLVTATLLLGMSIAVVGFVSAARKAERAKLGIAPVGRQTFEQIDQRLAGWNDVLADRFRRAVRNGTLTKEQSARLAERASAYFVEVMTGTPESYAGLMGSWGGEPKEDTALGSFETFREYWTEDQETYPFAEYAINTASVRVPAVDSNGYIMTPPVSLRIMVTAVPSWDFPHVDQVSNISDEVRVVSLDVESPSGERAFLECWWQWDKLDRQWIPVQLQLYTTKGHPIHGVIF